jgi:hypothetical protein
MLPAFKFFSCFVDIFSRSNKIIVFESFSTSELLEVLLSPVRREQRHHTCNRQPNQERSSFLRTRPVPTSCRFGSARRQRAKEQMRARRHPRQLHNARPDISKRYGHVVQSRIVGVWWRDKIFLTTCSQSGLVPVWEHARCRALRFPLSVSRILPLCWSISSKFLFSTAIKSGWPSASNRSKKYLTFACSSLKITLFKSSTCSKFLEIHKATKNSA